MEHEIVETYKKDDIRTLPIEQFCGNIYLIENEDESTKAVDYLLHKPLLGFDTETRPSFQKGKLNKVALLQVATNDQCFLFRLSHMQGLPNPILRLLQDCTVTKVGIGLKDDMMNLNKRAPFTPGTFIELQHEVARIGIRDKSLQKIYANMFGKKIAKRQQLSNWEADTLSPAQQHYAAIDAWACVRIYTELCKLLKQNETALS